MRDADAAENDGIARFETVDVESCAHAKGGRANELFGQGKVLRIGDLHKRMPAGRQCDLCACSLQKGEVVDSACRGRGVGTDDYWPAESLRGLDAGEAVAIDGLQVIGALEGVRDRQRGAGGVCVVESGEQFFDHVQGQARAGGVVDENVIGVDGVEDVKAGADGIRACRPACDDMDSPAVGKHGPHAVLLLNGNDHRDGGNFGATQQSLDAPHEHGLAGNRLELLGLCAAEA